MRVEIEIEAGSKTFASGLLADLIDAVRRSRPGNLFTIIGNDPGLSEDLATWCRFTRNTLVETTKRANQTRWVIRCGEAPAESEANRPVGSRLWLYTNFDCNLRCDYCCVRSSPKAPRRALALERIKQIAKEAAELGVRDIFVTGGEPFLLPNIDEILLACAAAAPTTVLTNGMLFVGRRLDMLRTLPRDRITLQISLDSPTPGLHDRRRGEGTWARALRGIENAQSAGFRVRLAATVSTDAEADAFRLFLDHRNVAIEDRVIRRIALRGFASDGIALARADLVPEITITADGVYWHPVGAEDEDLLVSRDIFPLAEAFNAVRRAFDQEKDHERRLAKIFNCA
jgi:TusA-related sulfurtransferase